MKFIVLLKLKNKKIVNKKDIFQLIVFISYKFIYKQKSFYL